MQDINEQFLRIIETEELRSLPSVGVTAKDLQNIVNEHSLEELDPDKDDAYLLHLIAPEALDDEEDNSSVDSDGVILHESKVLSVSQRLKRATNLRRLSKRYGLLRKIKAKRMAPPDRLNMRARKAALMTLRKKFLGNKKYSELSPQQKIQVDQELERRYGHSLGAIVRRLAQRLMSMVRGKEMSRVEKVRSVAESKKEDKKDKDDVKKDEDSDEDEDDDDSKRYSRKYLHSRREETGGDRFYLHRRGSRSASLEEARKGAASEVADEGDTGIIYQLRKAKNMKGNYDIRWSDGSKSRLPIQHVNAALLKIAQLVNRSGPGAYGLDKHKLVHKMGKSEDDFYKAMGLHEETKGGKSSKVEILPGTSRVFNKVAASPRMKERAPGGLKELMPASYSGVPTPTGGGMYEHNEVGSTEAAKKFAADTPGQTGDFSPHPLSAPVPWEDIPATHEELLKRLKKM